MTNQQIVKTIDDIEAELFMQFKRIERLRLDLQRQWDVLPSGKPQRATEPKGSQ